MDQLFNDLIIKPYKIKVPSPINVKEGFHLFWTDAQGKKYLSDVSPLKGYSQETLSEIFHDLERLKKQKSILNDSLPPCLDFALRHPLEENESLQPIRYQALIQNPLEAQDEKKLSLFRTLKIKTKDFLPQDVIKFVETLSKTHVIRLDAQRTLLAKDLEYFLVHNPDLYDFIEEPLNNHEGLKIALDETLYQNQDQIPSHPFHALVYKPTLCGSLVRIEKFLALAKTHQAKIILSSSYESSLGLKMLIKLHQHLNKDQNHDMGLDTFPIDEHVSYLNKTPPYLIP